jgi:hypothetical protein
VQLKHRRCRNEAQAIATDRLRRTSSVDDGEYNFIVGYRAAAAATVAAVRVEQGEVSYNTEVASSADAVIVLAYGDRPAKLSALDATGSVVSYADGAPAVETFRAAS